MPPLDGDDPRLLRANFLAHAFLSAIVLASMVAFWIEGVEPSEVMVILVVLITLVTLRSWYEYDKAPPTE